MRFFLNLLVGVLSLLPFGLLYAFSNAAAWLLHNLIAYRKKIIYKNLRDSFPEKSEKEIRAVAKRFYLFLTDTVIETLKMNSMSKKDFEKRVRLLNPDLFEKLYAEHGRVIFVMGHFGNWEWGSPGVNLQTGEQLAALYKPLSNKSFDEFFLKLRKRFGTLPIEKDHALRWILKHRKDTWGLAFIADQAPSSKASYRTDFLNRETSFFNGPEKIARKFNIPVAFASVRPAGRRGYYEIHLQLVSEKPVETKAGAITRRNVEILEEEIRKIPWAWLWSHKRWKRNPSPRLCAYSARSVHTFEGGRK